jgi:hypothetical protein
MQVDVRNGSKADIDVECAPGAGQVEVSDLTGVLGFRKMKAMARQQRSTNDQKRSALPLRADIPHL